MTIIESEIWDRFNNKSIPKDSKWLEDLYTLNLSYELRYQISEQLGLLAHKGWISIKNLLAKNGNQPELIYGAGICHQREACDFLLECLRKQVEPQLDIIKALECWGAFVTVQDLENILRQKSLAIRLAGLNLLEFKSHLLNESELLDLVEDLLNDFRDEVVKSTIKILQRRSEERIIDRITRIAINGSDEIVNVALIALGSIDSKHSAIQLLKLSKELVSLNHKELAKKQITHQFLSLNN